MAPSNKILIDQLKFDKSWSCLRLIMDKIEATKFRDNDFSILIYKNSCTIEAKKSILPTTIVLSTSWALLNASLLSEYKLFYCVKKSKLEAVYNCIISFLKYFENDF